MDRRQFISAATTGLFTAALSLDPIEAQGVWQRKAYSGSHDHELNARDEAFWEEVKNAYHVQGPYLYLNHGGSSPTPLATFEAENTLRAEARLAPSYVMWRAQMRQREAVRISLADYLACDPEQLALMRSTTEALVTVIQGLDLPHGSEILTTHHDYPTILHTLELVARRRGWKLVKIALKHPLDAPANIVRQVLSACTPQTKLLLLSDMLFQTGERMPIRLICEQLRDRDLLIAVDGAHTVGHVPLRVEELGCHFFASSLHKWLCAPLGTGMLWVDPLQIEHLWPMYGAVEGQERDIRKFEHLGTRSLPAEVGIQAALDFEIALGTERKLARLQYLTRYWWTRIKDLRGISVMTNLEDDDVYGGIASFTCPTNEEETLDRYLFREKGIIISRIEVAGTTMYRVSPHVHILPRDLDRLVEGIRAYVGEE